MKKRYKKIIELIKSVMPVGIVFAISIIFYMLTNSTIEGVSFIFLMISIVTGLYFIVYIIFIMITLLPYLASGIIGKIIGKFSRKRIVLDKSDFEKNKQYYREILKENTPLILGYLDKFELDNNKIIAELLYLQKEKVIELGNERIENKNSLESLNLKSSEKIFLNNIIDGKLRFIFLSDFLLEFRNIVAKDAEQLCLVNELAIKKKKLSKIRTILFLIASFALGMVISNVLNYYVGGIDAGLLILTKIIFWPISMLILMFPIEAFKDSYAKNKGKLYKRTAKGRELNQKLEGLKNYLKDYSLMDEREAKEIELWEDYLIYSVMFGQNKKIIEEYEKYIEIM